MEKIKINFRKTGDGARTSITLSSALVDTWLCAKELDDEDLDTGLAALRQFIEQIPPQHDGTYQEQVEWFLLSDVRDKLRGLN